jgi:hypothetical protein
MAGSPYFLQNLTRSTTAATLQNTYTTAKSVINATEVIGLPVNYFAVGTALKIKVRGGLSNIVTTPGTITFQVMIGSVVAWTSGALTINGTARTLLPFTLDLDLYVRTIGATTTATLLGMGTFSGVHLTNTDATINVPVTAPAAGTGFDSTAAANLDFWAGISVSNAGNGIQVQHYSVDQYASG